MTFRLNTRKRRTFKGSALTETGPALIILFIMILFPLIDMMYLGLAFGIIWYLNHLEVRELALRHPSETTQVLQDIDQLFVSQGLGKFVGLKVSGIAHPLPGLATRGGTPVHVTCTTVATIYPFLSLPFVMPVAGINQPVDFTVTSTRLQEEEGLN